MIIHLVEIMHMDCKESRPRWTALEAYSSAEEAEKRTRDLRLGTATGSLGHNHRFRIRGIYLSQEARTGPISDP
jgi:hypothetical protein